MRDDQGGAFAGNVAQHILNFILRPAVERAGRFVQHQHWRVFEQRAGDRHSLLFPTRQFETPFAHARIIAHRQAKDEVVDRRGFGGGLDLRLARALAAIANIISYRVVEQHHILRHDTDRRAQRRLRHAGDVLPVYADLARLNIVETEQDARDGGFARARRPHDRQRPPGRHGEADVVQYLAFGIIAKAYMIEPHFAARRDQGRRAAQVGNLLLRVYQPVHRFHVDQALPDRAIDHAEQVQRPEQLRQQRIDQHDIAGGELPAAPPPHGIGHRARHHQVGDQRLADIEPGQAILALHRRLRITAHRRAVTAGFAFFRAEIFDRFEIQQAVDGMGDSAGVHVDHVAAQLVAPFGHGAGEPDVKRDHGQRHDDEPRTELHEENDADRDQLQHGGRNVEQQEIEHRIDALGPALDNLRDRACAPVEMEAQRQAVQVDEHIVGQPPPGFLPDLLEHRIAQIIEQHAAKTRACIDRDQRDRQAGGRFHPRHHPVDRGLVGKGHGQADDLGRQHAQHGDDHPPPQRGRIRRPQIGQEPPERRPDGR